MSVIGPLKNAGQVERAVVARLRQRMSAYTADAVAQDGTYDALPPLRGIIRASELEEWPEDQKPVAVVVCPGTVDDPTKTGLGAYSATYSVSVAVIVSTSGQTSSRDVAQIYGAAVRGALLQGRSLNADMATNSWQGESLDDIGPDLQRTIFASLNLFYIDVDDVVSWKQGPLVDPDGEWPDEIPDEWPVVLEHEEDVDATDDVE